MSKAKYAWAMATLASATLGAEASAETFDRNALEELAGEPITLSATGAPQRATDAPVNMTIITQEEIRRSGAIDVPGVLERLASVDVMRTSRGMADASIRGYNTTMSPRLLVLVNGRQVYLDFYGMTNWDAIPVQLSEIRQIEVVAGPNTALFGFNAVGGVVNIITFDALHDDARAASVTAGDPDYAGASAVWTQRVGERLGVRLSAGGFEADAFPGDDAASQAQFGRDARDPFARNAALNLGYEITTRVRADFETTWSRDDRAGRFFSVMFDERYETSSVRLALSAETTLGTLNAQIYQNDLEQQGDVSVGLPFFNDTRTLVAAMSLLAKPAPAHTLRGGVEYRRNEMSQGFGDEIGYDVYALSGMWDWRINDALTATSAVRIDNLQLERSGPQAAPGFPLTNADFDREMTETSFNVGLVYRLGDADTLRLAGARGVASPSLNEFGLQKAGQFGPFAFYYSGNPDISSTIVDNVELGWDHDLRGLNARLRLSAFWQHSEDVKLLGASVVMLDAATQMALAENIGESEMVGLEAAIAGHAGRWHWSAHYSWRDIDDALTAPATSTGLSYEASSPEHVATVSLNWVGEHWEWGGGVRYTGETTQYGLMSLAPPLPTIETDAYVQANLHVAWLPQENLRVELSGRDLLENRTQTVGLSPLERSVYLTLSRRF